MIPTDPLDDGIASHTHSQERYYDFSASNEFDLEDQASPNPIPGPNSLVMLRPVPDVATHILMVFAQLESV